MRRNVATALHDTIRVSIRNAVIPGEVLQSFRSLQQTFSIAMLTAAFMYCDAVLSQITWLKQQGLPADLSGPSLHNAFDHVRQHYMDRLDILHEEHEVDCFIPQSEWVIANINTMTKQLDQIPQWSCVMDRAAYLAREKYMTRSGSQRLMSLWRSSGTLDHSAIKKKMPFLKRKLLQDLETRAATVEARSFGEFKSQKRELLEFSDMAASLYDLKYVNNLPGPGVVLPRDHKLWQELENGSDGAADHTHLDHHPDLEQDVSSEESEDLEGGWRKLEDIERELAWHRLEDVRRQNLHRESVARFEQCGTQEAVFAADTIDDSEQADSADSTRPDGGRVRPQDIEGAATARKSLPSNKSAKCSTSKRRRSRKAGAKKEIRPLGDNTPELHDSAGPESKGNSHESEAAIRVHRPDDREVEDAALHYAHDVLKSVDSARNIKTHIAFDGSDKTSTPRNTDACAPDKPSGDAKIASSNAREDAKAAWEEERQASQTTLSNQRSHLVDSLSGRSQTPGTSASRLGAHDIKDAERPSKVEALQRPLTGSKSSTLRGVAAAKQTVVPFDLTGFESEMESVDNENLLGWTAVRRKKRQDRKPVQANGKRQAKAVRNKPRPRFSAKICAQASTEARKCSRSARVKAEGVQMSSQHLSGGECVIEGETKARAPASVEYMPEHDFEEPSKAPSSSERPSDRAVESGPTHHAKALQSAVGFSSVRSPSPVENDNVTPTQTESTVHDFKNDLPAHSVDLVLPVESHGICDAELSLMEWSFVRAPLELTAVPLRFQVCGSPMTGVKPIDDDGRCRKDPSLSSKSAAATNSSYVVDAPDPAWYDDSQDDAEPHDDAARSHSMSSCAEEQTPSFSDDESGRVKRLAVSQRAPMWDSETMAGEVLSGSDGGFCRKGSQDRGQNIPDSEPPGSNYFNRTAVIGFLARNNSLTTPAHYRPDGCLKPRSQETDKQGWDLVSRGLRSAVAAQCSR